jgi:hypothetical protein
MDNDNPIRLTDLRPNILVQDGSTIYKVSTIYDTYVTMIVVYPIPPRTTVRTFQGYELARFKWPSKQAINKMNDAYA